MLVAQVLLKARQRHFDRLYRPPSCIEPALDILETSRRRMRYATAALARKLARRAIESFFDGRQSVALVADRLDRVLQFRQRPAPGLGVALGAGPKLIVGYRLRAVPSRALLFVERVLELLQRWPDDFQRHDERVDLPFHQLEPLHRTERDVSQTGFDQIAVGLAQRGRKLLDQRLLIVPPCYFPPDMRGEFSRDITIAAILRRVFSGIFPLLLSSSTLASDVMIMTPLLPEKLSL